MIRYRALIVASALATAMMASAEYYEVTGDNINLRRSPNGEIIGKIAKGTFFWSSGPDNGWIFMSTSDHRGFISDKYVREVNTSGFSRSMLGEYMGDSTEPFWSYSLGKLSENDGWLVLRFTDYSQPTESGMRISQGYTWVGVPTSEGITFKYKMDYINPAKSVTSQVADLPERDEEYVVTEASDGTVSLRGLDREFKLQEAKGEKDPKISERNLMEVMGPVKTLTKSRTFVPKFKEMYNSEGVEIHNIAWWMNFDVDGFITDYTAIDTDNSQILRECQYVRNGNKVNMTGTWWQNTPFKSNYSITTDNFAVNYSDGRTVVGTGDNVIGASSVDGSYPLGWNGMPRNLSIDEWKPPFIIESGVDESRSYIIRDGKTEGVALEIYWGGDAWPLRDLEYKEVQTDSYGNWIQRVACSADDPVFVEFREIEYY